uniref:Uncharacterized protein AlNc14C2G352 n=1 Tax=Albugo laibachii Nc14 TaxID=890382 RepID=F0VZL4_9STRA|nr:conserved hypothetical protein [Albugo laibachii Nc14]|eukprot:CCA14244.1 conserved hypothetical protein [Albugo laibachii Nc14]
MSVSEVTHCNDRILHVGSDSKSPASRLSIFRAASLESRDSVLKMESFFHHGFMKARLESDDSVYVENTEVFRQLDEYCDVDTMHQPRVPLLLLGESGSGKSAAVANWVERRKRMHQNWQSSTELVFCHVIGCLRQSCLVSNLLERMMREMKGYFELSIAIPNIEERLSWHLPDFLKAVSSEGRVIFIIDGLDRLCSNDGGSILCWIPVEFPAYVRVILTGTCESRESTLTEPELRPPQSPNAKRSSLLATRNNPMNRKASQASPNDTDSTIGPSRTERIEVEAKRRKWTIINTSPLGDDEKESIIRAFVAKKNATRVFYPRQRGYQRDALVMKTGEEFDQTIGFCLFQSQLRAIVSLSMSSNARFLKILLTCLVLAAAEGFDIHRVFGLWIECNSVEQLIKTILEKIEHGQQPDGQRVSQALLFLRENEDETISFRSLLADRDDISTRELDQRELCDEYLDSRTIDGKLVSVAEEREHKRDVEAPTSLRHANHLPGIEVLALSEAYEQQRDRSKTLMKSGELNTIKSHAASSTTSFWAPNQFPPYLVGGCVVPPLKKLLGTALSLLYVSRYGLLLSELRSVLEGMHTDEERAHDSVSRRLSSETDQFHYTSGTTSKEQGSALIISEDRWDALIRALIALEISNIRGVLVLPICKETLRGIIWERYMGSEEKECYYHDILIRHFQTQPVTFRKVEELPWHLKRCRQWEQLRATLVSLPNFQLLYTPEYKYELFSLWQLLIEGPLSSTVSGASQGQDQVFCKTSPSVGANHMDIVKEYTRHLEEWRKSAKPSTRMISRIVAFLANFMFDFSKYYHGSLLPEFTSHPTLDLKRLYLDGMHFVDDLPHARNLSNETISKYDFANSPSHPSGSAVDKLLPNLIMEQFFKPQCSGTAVSHTNSFYHYQRWVWIHFPWLALDGSALADKGAPADESVHFLHVRNSFVDGVFDKEIRNRLTNVLKPANSSETVLTTSRSKSDIGFVEGRKKRHNNLDEMMPHTTFNSDSNAVRKLRSIDVRDIITPNPRHRQKVALQTIGGVLRSSIRAIPSSIATTASPVFRNSRGSKSTEKITLSRNADMKMPASLVSLKTSISSPLLGIREPHVSIVRPTTNDRRKTGEDLTFMTQVDLVQAHHIADANKGLCDQESQLSELEDAMANTSLSKSECSDCGSVGELSKMESLKTFSSLVIPKDNDLGARVLDLDAGQSSWSLMHDYNRQVQIRLQQVYNDITVRIMKQRDKLQLLMGKVHAIDKEYEFMQQDCELAREALEEMHLRAFKLELLLQNVDKQDRNYRKVIAKCVLFPAQHPLHSEKLERNLILCQKTLENLEEAKKVLLNKKNYLERQKKPQFEKEIDKQKKLMNVIVTKLERAKEKLAHEELATDQLLQNRLQLIEFVQDTKASGYAEGESNNSEFHYDEDAATDAGDDVNVEEQVTFTAEMASKASARSIAAKLAAQQSEALCAKLLVATGLSSLHLLLDKFECYKDLQKSFDGQILTYENHLEQMNASEEELKLELLSLEVVEAASSKDDLNDLQKRLQAAETELVKAESIEEDAMKSYKQSIVGITKIVKLLGTARLQTPTQNRVVEKILRPSSLNLDESELQSRLESMESTEILNVLCICCKKLHYMIEISEADSCSTDAVFSSTKCLSLELEPIDAEQNGWITSHSSATSRQNRCKDSKLLTTRKDGCKSSIGEANVMTRSSIKASCEGRVMEEKRFLEKKKRLN